jgi:hypothetical protein
MNSDDMKMNPQIIPHRIALWGPAGSGKTWLIHALGRSLVNFQPDDPNFNYELREFSGEKFDPLVMPIALRKYEPTNELVDFMWLFRRQAKQDSYAHQMSAQTHLLHLHDVNGNEAVWLTEQVKQTYTDVKLLLILMDPMGIEGFSERARKKRVVNKEVSRLQNQGAPRSIVMTQDLYIISLKRLLDYVSEIGAVRPFVAICLTKRDLWKKELDPQTAIRTWFGQQMFDMLSQYGREFTMKTFVVSSCGYLGDNTQKPNYNKRTGELLSISQWNPLGIVNPFFWFLDSIERQKLSRTKSFLKNLIGRNRLKEFIAYPSVNDSLL